MLEVHVLAFAEKHERDQGFLVAEAVAEVAEQKATERAGQKLTANVTNASSVASTGSDLATPVKKMSPK